MVDEETHSYYPPVFFNEFWLLKEQLVPLNESVASLDLQLSLHNLASWKFMLYNQMEESFAMQVRISAEPCQAIGKDLHHTATRCLHRRADFVSLHNLASWKPVLYNKTEESFAMQVRLTHITIRMSCWSHVTESGLPGGHAV